MFKISKNIGVNGFAFYLLFSLSFLINTGTVYAASSGYGVLNVASSLVLGEVVSPYGGITMRGTIIDFAGRSRIYEDGELRLSTDNYIYLNAPVTVSIQNDIDIKGSASIGGNLNVNGLISMGRVYLPSNSVDFDQLIDRSVRTSTIADGSVTMSKLAGSSVGSSQIVDDSIQAADIASGAITSTKIVNGTITNDDVSNSAAIVYSKLSIADSDLSIAKTAGLQSALDAKLGLSGGTLSGDINLGGNNITNAGTITATTFSGNATTATTAGTANAVADGVITAAKLASSAVTTAKIADSNVTTAKIADGAVTASKTSTAVNIRSISVYVGTLAADTPVDIPLVVMPTDATITAISFTTNLSVIQDDTNYATLKIAKGPSGVSLLQTNTTSSSGIGLAALTPEIMAPTAESARIDGDLLYLHTTVGGSGVELPNLLITIEYTVTE